MRRSFLWLAPAAAILWGIIGRPLSAPSHAIGPPASPAIVPSIVAPLKISSSGQATTAEASAEALSLPETPGEGNRRLVDEIHAALQQLPLAITQDETRHITEAYLQFQLIRGQYEMQLYETTAINRDTVDFLVPPYPEAGDWMQAGLYDRLARDLGAERATTIHRLLGNWFDDRFSGFGQHGRTFRVTRVSAGHFRIEPTGRTFTFDQLVGGELESLPQLLEPIL